MTTYVVYPDTLDTYPASDLNSVSRNPIPFDTAAFNLTLYFGDLAAPPKKNINTYFLKDTIPGVIPEFKKLAHNDLCIMPALNPDKEVDGKNDFLLTCYPGKISKQGWSPIYERHQDTTKAKFFAFLWDRKFLTEEQIFHSNAVLGLQGAEILKQKDSLEKTNRFSL